MQYSSFLKFKIFWNSRTHWRVSSKRSWNLSRLTHPEGSPSYTIVTLTSLFRRRQWMAPHSSTLAWKIPWTEGPGGLQSTGSPRVGHDWATSLSLFTFMHYRRKWQPTPVLLTGESQGRGSLVDCRLWGCTESDTTERLSSSRSVYLSITYCTSLDTLTDNWFFSTICPRL